jgi:hypothetical protein
MIVVDGKEITIRSSDGHGELVIAHLSGGELRFAHPQAAGQLGQAELRSLLLLQEVQQAHAQHAPAGETWKRTPASAAGVRTVLHGGATSVADSRQVRQDPDDETSSCALQLSATKTAVG